MGNMGTCPGHGTRQQQTCKRPSEIQTPGKGAELPHLGAMGTRRIDPFPASRLSWVIRGVHGSVGCGRLPPSSSGDSLTLLRGRPHSVLTIFASEPSGHPVGPWYKYQFIYSVSQLSMLPSNRKASLFLLHKFGNAAPGVGDSSMGLSWGEVCWRF